MATPCLEWIGAQSSAGYGQVWNQNTKKVEYTHRRAWQFENGPIPDGGVVAHSCDNPPCCEPSHLFLTDKKGNTQDMIRKGRKRNGNEGKAFCPQGHPYDSDNTSLYRSHRRCLTCHRERERARRSRARR